MFCKNKEAAFSFLQSAFAKASADKAPPPPARGQRVRSDMNKTCQVCLGLLIRQNVEAHLTGLVVCYEK